MHHQPLLVVLRAEEPLHLSGRLAALEAIGVRHVEIAWSGHPGWVEQVRELACEQSYTLAPDSELRLFDHAVKDPRSGLWTMTLPEEKRFDALDGLPRSEWVAQQIPHIADSAVIKIHEG